MTSFRERVEKINNSLLPEREAVDQAISFCPDESNLHFIYVNLAVLTYGGAKFDKGQAKKIVSVERGLQ